MSSATIQGLDQDARYLIRAMAEQAGARSTPVPPEAAA